MAITKCLNPGADGELIHCCAVAGNREFVRRNPVATKRALRAILKATDFCAAEPEQAARIVAAKGYPYDYALQTMRVQGCGVEACAGVCLKPFVAASCVLTVN